MLGLLSTSACSFEQDAPNTRDPAHPCYRMNSCSFYRRLPDGGAAPVGTGDGGAADGGAAEGQLAQCGPCNG